QAQEVEHQRVDPGGWPNGEHGAPRDAAPTIRQIQGHRVVQHVDPRTVWPRCEGALLCYEPTRGEQRDDRERESHPIAASASCICTAVWYRSAGSFAIALRISCANASGTSGLTVRGSGGSSSRCFAISANVVSASNGKRRVRHSNSTTPVE